MTSMLQLYYAPDNASLCVRLLLESLEIDYQTVLVNRASRDQKAAKYLALNPNGLIPVLVVDGQPIYETGAILLHLSDMHPGEMFPALTNPDRAASLTRLFWMSNTLHTSLRMLFYPDQYAPTAATEGLRAMTRQRLLGLFSQLEDDEAAWLEAETASALGCYLAPLLRWAGLYGSDTSWFELNQFPRLLTFAVRFENLPCAHVAAEAEGLGPTPFSAPQFATPPEGTAT